MSKPTAQDLASAAGVSLSTVDRVLNNRGGVSEDRERRVLEHARKLNIDRALNQRPQRTLRIAVLLQPRSNPFHASVQDNFEAANRGFAPYNLQFQVHHIDPLRPTVTAQLIKALSSRCDGLVIISSQNAEIAAALRTFGDGKPVVTMVTDLRDTERYAYVGPDNRKAGRVAGDLMGRLVGQNGGEIVVIAGLISMIGHEEREMGFRTVLRERYPQCKVTEVLESMERGDMAGDLVFNALRKNPAIRGIYNASAGAQTVVNAMKKLGKNKDVIFITHELTEDRRHLMREGLIDAIIDQDPETEVRTAVEALAVYFGRREEHPLSLITPIHIHMIENCETRLV
ncbi:Transcriptional regulator, LacI family [Agrobacterium fabacearum S56]|uniref:LacI family DNA-binding transcriptional regulator n=1 Tax=Agrobacterium tumefaciens TaxID=358 RepID=UPI0009BAEE70|nr:LacI family DNA-binding transcriptional regulator [Agrobacterium tumefaciens]CUX06684.1 Transcriptional regulator, LacI family [Agrobacterium fabacearum S56]